MGGERELIARYLLVSMVVLAALGILSSTSYARIDPNSVVAIWLFEDNEDDILADTSGNEHDAMITGNPEWVDGKYGRALELDGVTYAEVAQDHADAFTLPIFTVAAWVGNMEIAGHQYVLCKGSSEPNRNYIMNIQDATGFFVSGFSEAGAWRSVVSRTNVADGKWHHLVGTYDGQTFKVYVNGVLETQRALAGPPAANDVPLRIGRGEGQSFPFTGAIDEVLIANVALEENDIKAIMNQGLERATGMTAVLPVGKLVNTWSQIKIRH
jgi:hypothetical protein